MQACPTEGFHSRTFGGREDRLVGRWDVWAMAAGKVRIESEAKSPGEGKAKAACCNLSRYGGRVAETGKNPCLDREE